MTENNFNKFRLLFNDNALQVGWVSVAKLKRHFRTMRVYDGDRYYHYEPSVIQSVLQHFFDAGFLIDVDFSFYRESEPTLLIHRTDPHAGIGVNVQRGYLISFEINDSNRFDEFCATIALLPLKFDVHIEELTT